MNLSLAVFGIIAFFLDLNIANFLDTNYFKIDFLLIFFLILNFLNADYKKTVTLAIIVGFLKGLSSIAPISIFIITFLILGVTLTFFIRNFIRLDNKNILLITPLAIVSEQSMFTIMLKFYFLIGSSSVDIIINDLFFKTVLTFIISETIILILIYNVINLLLKKTDLLAFSQ